MKLKKLLAAAVASALAITTMAVASFTASAATANGTFTVSNAAGIDGYHEVTITKAQIATAIGKTGATINSISNVKVNCTPSAANIEGFSLTYAVSGGGNLDEWGGYGQKDDITFADENAVDVSLTNVVFNSDGDLQVQINKAADGTAGATITVNSVSFTADYTDANDVLNMTFKDKEYELTVGAAPWGSEWGFTNAAQWNESVTVTGITPNTTTYADVKSKSVKLTGIVYKNCSAAGVTASDVSVTVYTKWTRPGDDTFTGGWQAGTGVSASNSTATLALSTLGLEDTDVLTEIGYQININGTMESIKGMANGDTVKVNSTGGTTPVTPEDPEDPKDPEEGGDDPVVTPPTGEAITLWSGSSVLATWDDNLQLSADKFADISSAGTMVITIADAINPGDWESNMFGMKLMDDGWATVMTEFVPENDGYGNMATASGTITAEITAERLAQLKQYGMVVGGFGITVTKVEYIPAGGSGSGDTPTPVDPTPVDPTPVDPTPSTPTPAPSTPAVPNTNPAPVSQTTIIDTILATPDGGNGSVSLVSNTKLNKLAVEAIATKGDVTIKFNVAGGAYWEINGQNVTDAKDVNLGVKVNSKQIPESKVEAFAGEKTTIQLSLSHNGDLGFTGTLNVPVGNANNGKFANLYYYHGGKFDFVGSSPIKGGRTQFAFSHASNYLIVIDDYAYGEDVSSAAGMTETAAETSTFPYVAVLVVIAAFGTSAIVLKKRLSK